MNDLNCSAEHARNDYASPWSRTPHQDASNEASVALFDESGTSN